jgi:hypothetical protein
MIGVALAFLLAPKSGWTQKLPDGTSVSLVALTNFGERKSWMPDGAPAKNLVAPSLLKTMNQSAKGGAASGVVNFMVQVRPGTGADEPTVAMKIGKQDLGYGFVLRDLQDKKMWWGGAGRPKSKLNATENLVVGVGAGAWKVSSSHDLENGITKGPKFFMSISHSRITKAGHREPVLLDVSLPPAVDGKAFRFKVYCSDGTVLQPAGSGPTRPGARRLFFVENNKRFVHVDLQTRTYTWVTFKGVHTHAK